MREVCDAYLFYSFSGDCAAYAFAAVDERCPSNVGDTWLYYVGNPPNHKWLNAGGGLILSCYEREDK